MADTFFRIGPLAGTGSEATLRTGSANGDVFREIVVINTTTTVQTFKMSIGADSAATRIADDISVYPDTEGASYKGAIYLASGETLRWTAPTTLTIYAVGIQQ
jgi:hypothetical protein